MNAKNYDELIADAWLRAGGSEEIRKSLCAAEHFVACRDLTPSEPIPVIAGAVAARATEIVCGNGRVRVCYLSVNARGQAMSRGNKGFYHPDYGTVSANRSRKLTPRKVTQPAVA